MENEVEMLPPEKGGSAKEDAADKIIAALMRKLDEDKRVVSEMSKGYSKQFRIGYPEFINLRQKLNQELNHLAIKSSRLEIAIMYSDGSHSKFSNWDEFAKHDSSKSEFIRDLAFEFHYSISLEIDGLDDRFKVEVGLRTGIDHADRMLYGALEPDSTPPNIRCSVEYTNYIVAKNLFSLIDKWVDALPKVNAPWHSARLQRQSYVMFCRYLIRSSALFGAITFGFVTLDNLTADSPQSIAMWGLNIFLFYACADIFNFYCSNRFNRWITRTSSLAAIEITQGDKRRIDGLKESNRSIFLKAIGYFFGGAGTIPFSFIASWIYNYYNKG
tara:strand:+ start:274 stop:1260 length:987 start_codon:yes stop_codon:yes gene_type:complete